MGGSFSRDLRGETGAWAEALARHACGGSGATPSPHSVKGSILVGSWTIPQRSPTDMRSAATVNPAWPMTVPLRPPGDPFTRTPEPWGRWKRPLHDTLHLPRPEKHAVRRVRLHTPSTRQHQRSGRKHRCYGGGGRAGARRGKSRVTKCTQSTLSAVAALGCLL